MTATTEHIDIDAYMDDAKKAVGEVFSSVRKALGLPEPTVPEDATDEAPVDPSLPFVMNPGMDAYRVLQRAEAEALVSSDPAAYLTQIADRYIRLMEIGSHVTHLTPSS
jgi:hypothetical protein